MAFSLKKRYTLSSSPVELSKPSFTRSMKTKLGSESTHIRSYKVNHRITLELFCFSCNFFAEELTTEPGTLELSAKSQVGATQNHWLGAQEVEGGCRIQVIFWLDGNKKWGKHSRNLNLYNRYQEYVIYTPTSYRTDKAKIRSYVKVRQICTFSLNTLMVCVCELWALRITLCLVLLDSDTHQPWVRSISGRDQKDTSLFPPPALPAASALHQ